MPDLHHHRPSSQATAAGHGSLLHPPSHYSNSRPRTAPANDIRPMATLRSPLSPINAANELALTDSLRKIPLSQSQHSHPSPASLDCLKPLPSVPCDINADDSFDDAGVELAYPVRPALSRVGSDNHIDSDISSASASSAASSSSMEPDWHETSLRKQVAKLPIKYSDVDLAQTEPPSVFGLRRRILAAALDHFSQRHHDGSAEVSSSTSRFEDKGISEWLAIQPSNSQWREKILRKKISFGRKHSKAALGSPSSLHDPMPNDAASAYTSSSRGRPGSSASSVSSHDKTLRRDKELADREANFDLVVLSRFEAADLKMTIYTEHRQGSWVVKGPAKPGATVLDEPPLVYSPWDCQIDSQAIVERKKLRSFVELSDTTCAVRCSTCNSASHQQLGKVPEGFRITPGAAVGCKQCEGTGAVQANYVVCVTLRQSNFTPLTMPVRHMAGKSQNAFRAYLPPTSKAMSHIDLLRMRSLEAVRSCALRVGRAHHKEHDARLLMAKAVLERRTCNSVAVINRFTGVFRTFDITDGGCIRGGAGMIEEESRIVESSELANALARLPVTTTVHPEGTHRFVDLELVDMATSKQLCLIAPSRSPSVYTSESSTDESYSPSAFSFFQRANDPRRFAGSTSRDSRTLGEAHQSAYSNTEVSYESGTKSKYPEAFNDAIRPALSSHNTSSSLGSYATAPDGASIASNASTPAMPNRPWTAGRSTPTGAASTRSAASGGSGRTMQTWETAMTQSSASGRSSGTIPAQF